MKYFLLFGFIFNIHLSIAQQNDLLKYKSYFSGELKPWVRSFDSFHLSDFVSAGTRKFENNFEQDFHSYYSFLQTYKPIMTFSPDSSKFIDLYSYQLGLEKKGNIYYAEPDVDQAVLLCDRKHKYWNRVCFGAPGGYFQEAVWLSDSTFILTESDEIDGNKRVPMIFIGNTQKQQFIIYSNNNSECIQKRSYYSPKLKRIKIKGL